MTLLMKSEPYFFKQSKQQSIDKKSGSTSDLIHSRSRHSPYRFSKVVDDHQNKTFAILFYRSYREIVDTYAFPQAWDL